MTTVPVTILDNFLDNPDDIREWASTLEYSPAPNNNYPGVRTECLSRIFPSFYQYINSKILSLFFPLDYESPPTEFTALTQFHYTPDLQDTGWIHQDPNHITALIYLSPPDPNVNRGTSIYKLKKGIINSHYLIQNDPKFFQNMKNHYIDSKMDNETSLKKKNYEENTFEKILDIKDEYNRLIVFDPKCYHANNQVNSSISPGRLTMISFINNVSSPKGFPITRSKLISQV